MLPNSIRLALQTLRANPLRTTLSILGVIMGAASLAAVLSIGDGAEAFARQRLEREGMQLVVLTPRTFDLVDGVRIPLQSVVELGREEAAAIAGDLGAQSGVILTRRGSARWQLHATAPLRATVVVGRLVIGPEPPPALAAGRDLQRAEMMQAASVAVVSATFADAVAGEVGAGKVGAGKVGAGGVGAGGVGAGGVGAVGRDVLVGGRTVRIVGVAAPTPGRGALEITVPEGLAESLLVRARDPQPAMIAVSAPTVEHMPVLRARLDQWVRARYGDRVTVASRGLDLLRDMAQGIRIFKMIMGAFTAISLLVGGIGIMNVLLASVIERTREIGIRKAIGARQRDVVVQFLTESVTIAMAGSLAGLVLGLAGAFAATAIIRARTQAVLYAAVSWETVAISLAASIVTGLAFGVYPAWRAARLSPVDAMRYE